MKRVEISIIWLVVVIFGAHMYMGTHLHMHSALRGLKISSPKQPPTDVATQHRMPESHLVAPGGSTTKALIFHEELNSAFGCVKSNFTERS